MGDSGAKRKPHWHGLLSERSQKFYDGTYKWNKVDGFWDENEGR